MSSGYNHHMKDERNKKFAKNLKAELVDVSESTVSLLERGLQTPSIFLVYDIANVLEIDINELLKNIQ